MKEVYYYYYFDLKRIHLINLKYIYIKIKTIEFYELNVDENRIKTIVGDLSLPRFGMSMKQWFDLEETIDVVVHNGVRFLIV